jgi:hypothetical protein
MLEQNMRLFSLLFLLLASLAEAAAQTSPNVQPFTSPSGAASVSTPLPSFPEHDWPSAAKGDFSPAALRQRMDESDGRSLQLSYYYALTSIATKKAAFSAELVTDTATTVRGVVTRSRQTAMYYFDEAGRKRHSYKGPGGDERIVIIDPQRQVGYMIRPDREDVLRVSGTPQNPLRPISVPGEPRPPSFSKQVSTQLGIKEFEGLKATGMQTETFYPPGAVGNDKEMVETREYWRIPQLGLSVYSRSSSPRFGERVAEYRNIQLGEPPASVFEIPANLKVRDVAPPAH